MRLLIPDQVANTGTSIRPACAARWQEKYDEPFDDRWEVIRATQVGKDALVELKLSADDGTPNPRSLRRPSTTVGAQPSSARNDSPR